MPSNAPAQLLGESHSVDDGKLSLKSDVRPVWRGVLARDAALLDAGHARAFHRCRASQALDQPAGIDLVAAQLLTDGFKRALGKPVQRLDEPCIDFRSLAGEPAHGAVQATDGADADIEREPPAGSPTFRHGLDGEVLQPQHFCAFRTSGFGNCNTEFFLGADDISIKRSEPGATAPRHQPEWLHDALAEGFAKDMVERAPLVSVEALLCGKPAHFAQL